MVNRKHFFLSESTIRLKKNNCLSWRRLRRAANERFSRSSVKGYYETQMTEAVVQTSDLLVGPEQWDQHFRRAAASMILGAVYAYPTLKPEQDQMVDSINDFADRLFKAATMGAHWVQFLPWMRYLPSR